MGSSTVPANSSLTHPDEQWNSPGDGWHFNRLQALGHRQRLHPRVDTLPLYNHIDDADHATEINDSDVVVWQQDTFNHTAFIRWGNIQRSIAIAIFSPTWGIFSRIPIWSVYLQVVNVVEEMTVAMRRIVEKLIFEGENPKLPFFECHIYEPVFENMPEEFVKCAMEVKAEVIRLVRPVLRHFVNYKFKIKPFKGMLIDNDEHGPAIEAQWIPDAASMVLAMCRELKPDGSYGKIENLDWVNDVLVEDVTKVPVPDWAEKLNRTESVFLDEAYGGYFLDLC